MIARRKQVADAGDHSKRRALLTARPGPQQGSPAVEAGQLSKVFAVFYSAFQRRPRVRQA